MAQLQTLVKALDILTLLGQSDHPMSVEELAVALGAAQEYGVPVDSDAGGEGFCPALFPQ